MNIRFKVVNIIKVGVNLFAIIEFVLLTELMHEQCHKNAHIVCKAGERERVVSKQHIGTRGVLVWHKHSTWGIGQAHWRPHNNMFPKITIEIIKQQLS